jgi:hypothetical protein
LNSAAERQRRARERKRRGGKTVNLEIRDWATWVEILREQGLLRGADSAGAVAAATTAYLFEECRTYQKEKAETELAGLRPAVVGLVSREAPVSMSEWKIIATKEGLPATVVKPKNVRQTVEPSPETKLAILEERLAEEGYPAADPWETIEAEAAAFETGMGIETKD